MASSSALVLVNNCLELTGDYVDLTDIYTSPNNIGLRYLNFLNLVIADLGRFGGGNWPQLRVDSQGLADGVTGIMEYSGSDIIRADGPVSVWLGNRTMPPLDEVTPAEFNTIVANNELTGLPSVFQRGVSSSGNMTVQIFPIPAKDDIINVTAYRKPTKLASNTDTTDFDDDILIAGAMKHADAYDGLDRGYGAEYANLKAELYTRVYGNMKIRITPEDYH